MILTGIGLLICCFFIGGIPTGYLVVKAIRKKDIRNYGSGNIGFSNVLRNEGTAMGASVIIIDVGKSFLATYFFSSFFPTPQLFHIIFGITVILGNIFSPFLNFKGGKGVATGLGVALAVGPLAIMCAVLVFVAVVALTRYMSLGSLTGAATFLVVNLTIFYSGKEDIYSVIFSLLLCATVVLSHTSNIKRLIRGEENKIGKKEKKE